MLEQLPLLVTRALTVFPNTSISIDVTREKSIKAIKFALDNKIKLVSVAQIDPEVDEPKEKDLFSVGTLIDVNKILKVDDDTYRVLVDGICVVDILNYVEHDDFYCVNVAERITTGEITDAELVAYKTFILSCLDVFEDELNRKFPKHVRHTVQECEEATILFNIATGLLVSNVGKQELLASQDLKEKFDLLCECIAKDIDISRTLLGIEQKVHDKITNNNKEYLLREQIRSIQEELGEDDENVYNEYIDKINALNADDEIKEKLIKDLDRYNRMNESAPESAIIRNYLDWVLDLPWGKLSQDCLDLKKVMDILNEDHYGIDQVKKRIVEYLAVRLMTNGENKGAVLCLVGPPGVGKTSIAKSIAKALGKDYVQLTLGGVHDEAEIRGHRKTYIGAMPGRIMSSLAKSKTNNPLFLLDEVDKITRDMRGDPAAALLEVLDPNQNSSFRDNYLEIPYDLSDVMFVLTANDLSEMDKPLLDRLEIIEMSGYTVEEKVAIAQKYLVPKQCVDHGLNMEYLNITKPAIIEIIEGYTRESGVRELERKIATVCRKIAYDIVVKSNGDKSKMVHNTMIKVGVKQVRDALGTRIYEEIDNITKGAVGKVTGLAWTSVGGTTLDIEVCVMQGKGDIKLTGKLGDVMKESAMTAISVIRSKADKYGIPADTFTNNDIHIHVPKGATPKDGPSAGITIATAVLSALTGKKVRDGIAMTGEISLNGRVLAIGGLKEKSLAAHRVGVDTILIPRENEKDLAEVPESVKKKVTFKLMEDVEEVFKEALYYEN